MKSNLSLRYMYVRTAEHIRDHFLCCVLALVILRLIERRSKETAKSTPLTASAPRCRTRSAPWPKASAGWCLPRTLITAEAKNSLEKEGNEKTAEKIASGALKPDLAAVEKTPGIKPCPRCAPKALLNAV